METIKQKIRRKRGEYERKRRKKYLYLKQIGRYKKRKILVLTSSVKELKLSWWEKMINWVKQFWKKIYGN